LAFDYFTVRALAAELSDDYAGRCITQAASGGDQLALACSASTHLLAVLGSGGWLYRAPGTISGGVREADGVERYLAGARVESVRADARDRVIRLRLTRTNREGAVSCGELILELIPPRWRAALVNEQTRRVLGVWPSVSEGWAGRRVAPGSPHPALRGETRCLPGVDASSSFAEAVRAKEGSLVRALCRVVAGADRHVAAEMAYVAGVSMEGAAADSEVATLDRLWEAAAKVYGTPTQRGGHVWAMGGELAFSALRPARPVDGCRSFESLSDAIRHCREVGPATGEARRSTDRLVRDLTRRQRSLERRVAAMRGDLEEAAGADDLERHGSTLLAQLALVPTGAREARLPDPYDAAGQRTVLVPLDPERTAAANAARMLKRAKRLRRRQQALPERLERVEAEADELSQVLCRLGRGETLSMNDMQRWSPPHTHDRVAGRGGAVSAHPRRYVTSSGWTVLAGRSNEENDVLTHRIAAQEDLWFHASGYPGSHVILRRDGRRDEPGAQTLAEAAGVAAYWSKGRSAKRVPVMYTRAKHVSKPRGAPAGQAMPRRVRTLMATPALLPLAHEPEA